jgi:hypothetical protein
MTSEKGKLKKLYIEALIEKGDKRSYNELKADLELDLWHNRFNGNFEITPNTKDVPTEPNTEV